MKITSGQFKGRNLTLPKSGIKPTSEKVRQAVLNLIRTEITGARFLDLFAGGGGVGIEALSNGADFACFVEANFKNFSSLRQNLSEIVGDESRYKAIRMNALIFSTGEQLELFDYVFADPYYRNAEKQFGKIHHVAMSSLKAGGLFILEHAREDRFDEFEGFSETRSYGDTRLTLFEKEVK